MTTELFEKKPLIEVKQLKQYFNEGKKNEVRAVNDVTFTIYEGEIFGLVGESGSGKSTTGRALIKLSDISSGEILFDGKDITSLSNRKEMIAFRKDVQMIFQDPYASLNPRMTVMEIIGGAMDVHGLTSSREERNSKVYELLETVGLDREYANRYPKEFSGGQCQRIGIARALAVQPKFIIADEAISALDVSIQAQIINLLKALRKDKKLTYLFIAHDLAMVKYISNRIGVMNSGRLLEVSPSKELYHAPLHPYTESLLSAIPEPDPEYERQRNRITYNPEFHLYTDEADVRLHEIAPEHFVYCSLAEVSHYQEKRARLLNQS